MKQAVAYKTLCVSTLVSLKGATPPGLLSEDAWTSPPPQAKPVAVMRGFEFLTTDHLKAN